MEIGGDGRDSDAFGKMDPKLKKWIEKTAAGFGMHGPSALSNADNSENKEQLRKAVDAEADRLELNDNERFEAQDYAVKVTSGKDINIHNNPPQKRASLTNSLLRWK